jgi:hypothetical protein
VRPEKVEIFHEQARLALSSARASDGLLYGEIGRQIHADCAEDVVFLTVWKDLESLYGWIGGNDLLCTPILRDGDGDVFDQVEVQHYESWGDAAGAYDAETEFDVTS